MNTKGEARQKHILKRLLISWIVGVVLLFLAHARSVYTGESFFDPEYWSPNGYSVYSDGGYKSASFGYHAAEFWSDSLEVLPAYAIVLIFPIAGVALIRWIIRGKGDS